ncbi:MAG: hypothetical protein EB055_01770, partial [Micrococcales bacterium]|nr:hypothetical protein [Micrococcales bacterium]
YIMIFSCVSFVYAATQGSFLGLMYNPIETPMLLSVSYVALFIAFILSMKNMAMKLRIVGLIYCLAGLAVSYVLWSPFIDAGGGSAFLLLYPIGLVMVGTFYLTYFWIAIRAQLTLAAAMILAGLSVVLIGTVFIQGKGSPAETIFIGVPGLIVSTIAYFMARRVIASRKITGQ